MKTTPGFYGERIYACEFHGGSRVPGMREKKNVVFCCQVQLCSVVEWLLRE
jgi:hypothetical protein